MQSARNLIDKSGSHGTHGSHEHLDSLENKKQLKERRATFYAVLKHGNLFLYPSEEQVDVKHVIVLVHHVVSIYPPNLRDGRLWIKNHAICLSRKPELSNEIRTPPADQVNKDYPPPNHAYFIFNTNNSVSEDWYFALIRASKSESLVGNDTWEEKQRNPAFAAVSAGFRSHDLFTLLQSIHSSDLHQQTQWINALCGRIFLATYRTQRMENWFRRKVVTKLQRVKLPAYLSEIVINRIDLGDSIPYITQPRLRELSTDGEMSIDLNVSYGGNFRIEFATVATIQLGNHFKARQISLSIAVTLRKLEGTLLVRIKKPPSNRIWYAFHDMPKVCFTICIPS